MSDGRFGTVMDDYVCDTCKATVDAYMQLYVHAPGDNDEVLAECVPCATQDPVLMEAWKAGTPKTERAKYNTGVDA